MTSNVDKLVDSFTKEIKQKDKLISKLNKKILHLEDQIAFDREIINKHKDLISDLRLMCKKGMKDNS